MNAIDKWKTANSAIFEKDVYEAIRKRKENNIPDDKTIAKFSTFEECVEFARKESEYNWYNYYPDNKTLKNENPIQFVKNRIYRGKLAELIFTFKCKNKGYKIVEAPTVFSKNNFPKYDLIVEDKKLKKHICDIKCTKEKALEHKQKHKDVEVIYVVSNNGLRANTKDIEKGNCTFLKI